MSILSAPHFHNEEAAIAFLEGIIYANGVFCPHCGNVGESYKIKGQRPGLRCCKACRKQFRVTVNTVFESSHIKVHQWLQATYLLSASKKGMSAHQLHRMMGVTYKTGWFMFHRIREAMRTLKIEPMGGEGKVVEADETYVGGKERNKHKSKRSPKTHGGANKEAVVSIVERDGKVHSFHMGKATTERVTPMLSALVHNRTVLVTDDTNLYNKLGKKLAAHQIVKHSLGQYVIGEVHTNTIEGFFGIFKKGMVGVYQHCGKQHLQRYLDEFDFRYNERKISDLERTNIALAGIVGKRLTYRGADKEQA